MLIDEVMPRFDFAEHHQLSVNAGPASVFRAIQEIRPADVWLLGFLMAIRNPGARRSPAGGRSLLAVALTRGFHVLGETPNEELLLGIVGQFWRFRPTTCMTIGGVDGFRAFAEPGFAKAVMNFHVTQTNGRTRVATETRIVCTDAAARRKFAMYWTVVHPGSAIIRRVWLRAIRRKAEGRQAGPAHE